MAELAPSPPAPGLWARIDKAWALSVLALVLVAVLDPANLWPVVRFAAEALVETLPFILFAVLAVAFVKASGAEKVIARAFEGPQWRMILFASALGGLSPFCSCEVIPFIAALLAVGAPLSAVMAFWLASPLMDPMMFSITAGALGWDFAVAKAIAAIGVGILGGSLTALAARSVIFADPLRTRPAVGGCCGVKAPFQGRPVWRFWTEAERRRSFRDSAVENGLFLLKWLTLAYIFEALMESYVPASLIATWLGGSGIGPILWAALAGAPAYLNGYAAVGVVDGLLTQGMSDGAAMSFMIAGGVSCIPAAIAVWALVKPRIFAAYVAFGFTGAVLAGLAWNVAASG